ncbi:DUF2171 domain-containing protein [Sphingomonas yantingensis]|uniref:DUF2171 domain-containing protein n=1 Tax=Sphingomonas yantingensis TaxID=1241761 RepID=A0A7W9EGY5_9SPHN|nr:DUF2171 domain-containing protein [Sphingomonas yantingensis]MBB5697602.1 hypothetical protein [Sphingomonas yantingensis]
MGNDRNPRDGWRNDDDRDFDYGRESGARRDYGYSSDRDYGASPQYGDNSRFGPQRDRSDFRGEGRDYYGSRETGRDQRGYYGQQGGSYGAQGSYGSRDSYGSRSGYGSQGNVGAQGSYGRGRSGYGGDQGRDTYGFGGDYQGYGQRDYGQRDRGFGDRSGYQRQTGYGRDAERNRGYAGQPQGYDYEERGFFDRAGDEVRSWFGDEEAERRREQDRRLDERYGNSAEGSRDEHYSNWRRQRIGELDRDYDEYRRENATKFENEFNSFRTERQTQRSSLAQVNEHMEVVGSDGEHVGTVDKVRGDRIILTKNDVDAGGRHHSIPSRWIDSVDGKVKIRKTAAEAKAEWRDEERNQAMFGDDNRSTYGDRTTNYGEARRNAESTGTSAATPTSGTASGLGSTGTDATGTDTSGTTGNLGKSFSGTY